MTLTSSQLSLIGSVSFHISQESLENIIQVPELFTQCPQDKQLAILQAVNACYRGGEPCVDDIVYDAWQNAFATAYPEHPFVNQVEPESILEGKTVQLPKKMLSTDKAYSEEAIRQWLSRLEKTASSLHIAQEDIVIRVMPKLDGYAAYDDGTKLYTRGNGLQGRDISFAFERGLKVANGGTRGLGQGEIVIEKDYFTQYLAPYFENSRNIQAAIIAEKNIDPRVQQAINEGVAVFCPFVTLSAWVGSIDALLKDFEAITQKIWHSSIYNVDGVVLQCDNKPIQEAMGDTRHHHRWQIALKNNTESAQVIIQDVIPQTSRNGRITPVVLLEPTRLSGAEITRATAHNYKMVRDEGIGIGTKILLVRSGMVIPKIEAVLEPAEPLIPDVCPCCGEKLVWIDDNLFCVNKDCRDQIEKTIIHFFETLGNNDGFGPATISILYDEGIRLVSDVYQLQQQPERLAAIGYKEKTVENLVDALQKSQSLEIEDWRFLAAFGVQRLGLGIAEKLLSHHKLESIFQLTTDDIIQLDGFAEITAKNICEGLAKIKPEFDKIYALGFNLKATPLMSELSQHSSIAGKRFVFTGKMLSGSRPDMEKGAKALGASVGKSVSGKTDYLVTGEKVGASKIKAAQEKGVTVISEAQYLDMISD